MSNIAKFLEAYIPDKAAPLLLFTEKYRYCFMIAPMIWNKIKTGNWLF